MELEFQSWSPVEVSDSFAWRDLDPGLVQIQFPGVQVDDCRESFLMDAGDAHLTNQ